MSTTIMKNRVNTFNSLLVIGSNASLRKEKIISLAKVDVFSKSDPDIFLLSTETPVGIEDIRNLQRWLSLKPFFSENKIAVIFETQNISIEAQNSLLKTLEEPPKNALIILSAQDASFLLQTVVSRCLVISLFQKESRVPSFEEEKLNKETITKILLSSVPERFLIIEQESLAKDRQTAIVWIDKMIGTMRNSLFEFNTGQESFFNLSNKQFLNILSCFQSAKNYLNSNCNVRLTLEIMMIGFPYLLPRLPTRQHPVLNK